jgi:hypothetical protein
VSSPTGRLGSSALRIDAAISHNLRPHPGTDLIVDGVDQSFSGWEEISFLEIDSAVCAFGDAELLGQAFVADPSVAPRGKGGSRTGRG